MFAYVGSRTTKERNAKGDGINVYQIEPSNGHWHHRQLVGELVNPSFLALAPNGRFLYAVHGDQSEVSAFAIAADSGRLSWLNTQASGGNNPVHLTITPDGKLLIIANYASGNIVALPIAQDGSLGRPAETLGLTGTAGPHRHQQAASHPHQAQFDPVHAFVVVPDKGVDRIFSLRCDRQGGSLQLAVAASVATRDGAGPRHIAFHPEGNFAFAANELDSTITTYAYDRDTGKLSALQIVPSVADRHIGNNTAAEIAVSGDGRFVYCSNRGADTIGVFFFDQQLAELRALEWVPSLGAGPRFFTLSPDGAFLYAANEHGHTVTVFSVHRSTGRLCPTGQTIAVGSPVCIVFSAD
ncbi:lactonase family protein [Janthinobacterium sp.]|uniref:lactonase family protein n=1 Tax=Janthinobacterium sp. TaxID=1871054 RepID=UPI0026265776|nr:lactonase family protein [Janthinobacterium sp.]